jgi:hypothetical protein
MDNAGVGARRSARSWHGRWGLRSTWARLRLVPTPHGATSRRQRWDSGCAPRSTARLRKQTRWNPHHTAVGFAHRGILRNPEFIEGRVEGSAGAPPRRRRAAVVGCERGRRWGESEPLGLQRRSLGRAGWRGAGWARERRGVGRANACWYLQAMTVEPMSCRSPHFSPNETERKEPGRSSTAPVHCRHCVGRCRSAACAVSQNEPLVIGAHSSACGAIRRASMAARGVIIGSRDESTPRAAASGLR